MLPRATRLRRRGESSGKEPGGRLRRVLVALGVAVAVGYAAARLRSGSERPGRPEASCIDVDERGETGAGGGRTEEPAGAGGEGADLDREMVEERAIEGAGETPAQPGELEVAEELAEEALDEDVEATPPDDETPGPDPEDAETGE
jgi:hypothetical protein